MTTQSIDARIASVAGEIQALERQLAELRSGREPEAFADYTFKDGDGAPITLSSLFGDASELLLVHNMGRGCRFCTLWADGFNGVADHLADRAAFVVASPDEPEVQRAFARSRGWTFRMVSVSGTTFSKDAGYEMNGSPTPGVSTFPKTPDGGIERVGHAPFGPGDRFCGVWHLLDLLPEGRKGWEPKYEYAK